MTVQRFNCTNGGAKWCQGCYTMERDDAYGDYVRYDDYASLQAGMEQLHRIPQVIPLAREVEFLLVLRKFMNFQVSEYDRVATRAQDYCAIRREARQLLQRYDLPQIDQK